jgi:hypothetical protein
MRGLRPRSATIGLSILMGALGLLALPCDPAHAQRLSTSYQYSVKAICTYKDIGFGEAFAPGRYRTVINIHNPTEKKTEIVRKFALAGKPTDPAGSFSITPYKALTLEADQAVAYSCFDIADFFCPINGVCVDFTAIDGFLVINSLVELDVVAVYTANPKGGEVSTMDTETVAGRNIRKTIVIRPDPPRSQQEKRIQGEPFKPIQP